MITYKCDRCDATFDRILGTRDDEKVVKDNVRVGEQPCGIHTFMPMYHKDSDHSYYFTALRTTRAELCDACTRDLLKWFEEKP